MVLSRLEEDSVAGADLLDRAALALAAADALGDEDRLAERVRVPGRAGARGEVDARRGGAGRCFGHRDGIDVDVAGEPVLRALHRRHRVSGDLHVSGLQDLFAVFSERDVIRLRTAGG